MNSPHLLANNLKQTPSLPIANPIYYMVAPDESMEKFHIPLGATVTVDLSIVPNHKHIVVVELGAKKLLRRLVKAPRTWVLESGVDKPLVIDIEKTSFFGVVTKITIKA